MQTNELWNSKELKRNFLKILGKNPNGTIALTFEVEKMTPKRIHNFNLDYLEMYYEPTGTIQQWTLDNTLMGASKS